MYLRVPALGKLKTSALDTLTFNSNFIIKYIIIYSCLLENELIKHRHGQFYCVWLCVYSRKEILGIHLNGRLWMLSRHLQSVHNSLNKLFIKIHPRLLRSYKKSLKPSCY